MNARPIFRHPILKHVYVSVTDTTPSWKLMDNSAYGNKVYVLSQKLDGVTGLELVKLPNDKRPEQYVNYMNRYHVAPVDAGWKESELPETWSFFDDMLVKQLDKMWREHERDQMPKARAAKKKAACPCRAEGSETGVSDEI
jgi:hypothetical protein